MVREYFAAHRFIPTAWNGQQGHCRRLTLVLLNTDNLDE